MPRKKYGIPDWATRIHDPDTTEPPYATTEPIVIDGAELHLEWWLDEGVFGVIKTESGDTLAVSPSQLKQIHAAIERLMPLLDDLTK